MKRCPSCKTAFPTEYTHCPRDGSSLNTVGEWAEGTIVRGKYRILAKVGQGGMGSVYKAMHARFKEVRAIKVISPELANDASFVRRFDQEAIITRKLQHPNAVRVEDIDEAEDGRPFIVMEYIEGRSLKEVIEREAPLDVQRVCAIIKQAAAVLDAAHGLGLVHRDIKPANIAVVKSKTESGTVFEQVKILDFGIAKLKEAQSEDSKATHLSHLTLTSTGVIIGTPAYMSPEQARGMKGDQLDVRSDIYSLGVVMYQMLTGELPLKADSTIEQLMAHINVQPKPIREVRPSLTIPGEIEAAVMHCLEKNRDLRPLNGKILISELELERPRVRIQSTPVPVPIATHLASNYPKEIAYPPSRSLSVPAWRRRRWAWALVSLAVGTVFTVVLYILRHQTVEPQKDVKSLPTVVTSDRNTSLRRTAGDSSPEVTKPATNASGNQAGDAIAKIPLVAAQPSPLTEKPAGDVGASGITIGTKATPGSLATDNISPGLQAPRTSDSAPQQPSELAPPLAAQPAAANFTLVIRASENSWISVVADGRPASNATLIAPASTTVRAKSEIIAKIGNTAGVTFVWNGQEIRPVGTNGEVATFVFDASGMRVLTTPDGSSIGVAHIGADTQQRLLDAVTEGQGELVARLLDAGADINEHNGEETPLIAAIKTRRSNLVRLLLSRGADPNLGIHATPLAYAVLMKGNNEIVRTLLSNKANVDAPSFTNTPLILASQASPDGQVRCAFREMPCDAERVDHDTNLIEELDLEVLGALLDHGANINARGYLGRTALMEASVHGHTEAVRFLIKRGANVNLRDSDEGQGRSALGLATELRHKDIVKMLRTAGARD